MAKIEIGRKEVVESMEIKPCPFCGSEDIEVYYDSGNYGYTLPRAYVKCKSCGAKGAERSDYSYDFSMSYIKKCAVDGWNRRAK